MNGGRRRFAYPAVVPGLIADAGDGAFVRRISQDKAVLPAVLHEPALLGGLRLLFVQQLVAAGHDVQGQTGMVLAGTGFGHPFGSFGYGVCFGIAPGQVLPRLVVKQLLLFFPGAEGGADQRIQPGGPGVIHHILQIRIGPLVNGMTAPQLGHGDGIVLRQGIPGVDQHQIPGQLTPVRLRFGGENRQLFRRRLRQRIRVRQGSFRPTAREPEQQKKAK